MITNGGKHRKPETVRADWRFAKALGLTLSSMGVVGAIAFTSVPKPASMTVRADVEQPETEPAPEVPYVAAQAIPHHPMAPVAEVTPLEPFSAPDEVKAEVRAQREHSDKPNKPKYHERARDEHHDRDHHDRGGRHRADHQRRAFDGHGHWSGAGRHHRDDRDHGRDRGDHGGRADHHRGGAGHGHHGSGGSGHERKTSHGGGHERDHGGGHHGRD